MMREHIVSVSGWQTPDEDIYNGVPEIFQIYSGKNITVRDDRLVLDKETGRFTLPFYPYILINEDDGTCLTATDTTGRELPLGVSKKITLNDYLGSGVSSTAPGLVALSQKAWTKFFAENKQFATLQEKLSAAHQSGNIPS